MGLVPVAQLVSYKGLLFATFDPSAPPLLDYLGSMTRYVGMLFDRSEGGTEILRGVHKWVVPCYWKSPAENFIGDAHHVQWSHLATLRTGFGITRGTSPGGGNVSPGNGHGFIAYGGHDTAEPVQVLVDYEEETRDEFEARLGPRAQMLNPVVGTVFPNFSVIKTNSHSFRVWHPKSPNSIELWAWAFTGKAAPPEVKETIRKIAAYGFSPPGTFEQDDMDNWQECTRTSRGVVVHRQMLNYQIGLGYETWNPDQEALTSQYRFGDSNQRQFYKRWSELMAADIWAEL